jgi:tetratricopeptide (TPR) repeat protein
VLRLPLREGAKLLSVSAPHVPRRDLTQEFADAYRSAALTQVDMVRAAHALEAVRLTFADRRTGLRGLDSLDEQVGLADNPALRSVLDALRKTLFGLVAEDAVGQLATKLAENRKSGTVEWIGTYGAALRYWRVDLCEKLCDPSLELASDRPSIERFAEWTRLMIHDRWAEVTELFEFLSEQPVLPADSRAQYLVNLAQIELYHLGRTRRARARLDEAMALAPDSEIVLRGFGEYRLMLDEPWAAKELFTRAAELDERSEATASLGDAYRQVGDLQNAEYWYRETITRLPGSSVGYLRLLRYFLHSYGDPDPLSGRPQLLEEALAADPQSEYNAYITLALAHQEAGLRDQVQPWLDRAVAYDDTRPNAWLEKGYAFGGEQQYDDARNAFERVVELAPTALDGYLALVWLAEQRGDLEAAVRFCESALERVPSHRARITARLGGIRRKQNRHLDAERELLAALRIDPDDSTASTELSELVTQWHSELDDRERAEKLLSEIRSIRGDAYDYDYWNRFGNVAYSFHEYDRAAEAYEKSIEANPESPVVHRNLATALREVSQLERAKAELDRALELDLDQAAYDTALGLVLNAEGLQFFNEQRYTEAAPLFARAAELRPGDPVLPGNHADAWQNTWGTGARAEALDEAEKSLRRALELAPGDDAYEGRLHTIEFERALLTRYGEPPLGLDGTPRVVAIELGDAFLDDVRDPVSFELTPHASELIEALRSRVRDRCDLPMPAIRFTEGTWLESEQYTILVLEHHAAEGATSGRLFVGSHDKLDALGIESLPAKTPAGEDARWVGQSDWDAALAGGLKLWPRLEYPLRHLEEVLLQAVLGQGAGRPAVHRA